jgi:glyoxylase-like metal-dependent hydrolase (beta-lactamase superfamily II)
VKRLPRNASRSIIATSRYPQDSSCERESLQPWWCFFSPTGALAEIGVDPAKIEHVAFSHTHGDHVGNGNLFTGATLDMQQAKYDIAFRVDAVSKWNFEVTRYNTLRGNKTVKLNGDHDVFGDGAVVIIATPGHTPGHQSLWGRLPKTGPVILSGDMVHLQDNWTHRRVPSFNFDVAQSLKSMEKVAGLMQKTGAKLWINHDQAQSDAMPKAPQFIP